MKALPPSQQLHRTAAHHVNGEFGRVGRATAGELFDMPHKPMTKTGKQSSEAIRAQSQSWFVLCSVAKTAGLIFPLGVLTEALFWLVTRKAPDSLWRIAVDLTIISFTFGVIAVKRRWQEREREHQGTADTLSKG